MKTRFKSATFTLFCSVLVFSYASAQEGKNQRSSWRASGISLDADYLFQMGRTMNLEDVRQLDATFGNPTDFSNYQPNHSWGIFNTFYGSSFGLNWHFTKETAKRNWVWTIGLQYQTMSAGNASFHYSVSAPYDTLTSSQTGEEYYVDSTYSESYSMDINSDLMLLKTSLQMERTLGNRITLRHGVGVGFGMSVRDQYRKNVSHASTVQNPYNNGSTQGFSFPFYEGVGEVRSGETLTFYLTAPLEFDVTLGTKRPFFQQTSWLFNFRPGMQWYFHEHLGTHFTPSLGLSTGLKFNFNS